MDASLMLTPPPPGMRPRRASLVVKKNKTRPELLENEEWEECVVRLVGCIGIAVKKAMCGEEAARAAYDAVVKFIEDYGGLDAEEEACLVSPEEAGEIYDGGGGTDRCWLVCWDRGPVGWANDCHVSGPFGTAGQCFPYGLMFIE